MTASTATDTGLRPVSEAQLRGLLERFLQDAHRTSLLLVRAAPTWDGPETLEVADTAVRVVEGTSVLAVRTALVDHPGETLAVVTHLTTHDLGEEVAARAWRNRVERPDPWNAVMTLFRAHEMDPKLRAQRWMIEVLVDLAPARGYSPTPNGVLTTRHAWEALYTSVLGLPTPSPSPGHVLTWVASDVAGPALDRIGEDARQEVTARLARDAGPAAPVLLAVADRDIHGDVLPLGLVVDALWPDPNEVAAALLSTKFLSDHEITPAAAEDWGAASRRALDELAEYEPDQATATVQRAEQLLVEVKGQEHVDSALLPSGLATRVRDIARTLATAMEDRPPRTAGLRRAERALVRLEEHRDASADRVELCRAVIRLLRRGEPVASTDGDLTTLTEAYLEDGSWVDAARERLLVGDTDPTLAELSNALLQQVEQERRARDRLFAAAVAAQATSTAPDPSLAHRRPLRIENVLDTVVAPLAEQTPVLLLVLDGLSHAAAVTLVDDLREEGWRPHGPVRRQLPGVVAALPTVTVTSRATLLSGRLTSGGQDVEQAGFTSHAGLVDVSGSGGSSPILFHKKAMRTKDGHVAPAAREALADSSQRIVGVVFNGVDDFLGDGEQLRLADGLDGLPLLRNLLRDALEGGRTVVVTSDHGHVLGTNRVVKGAGGERYRYADRPAEDGEIELSGARVLDGDGTIVAAADNEIRYYAPTKRGHHGGATPAEVLCPLIVLVSGGGQLDGWEPLPATTPDWWDPDSREVTVATAPRVTADLAAPADAPQPCLFDEPAASPSDQRAWIQQLLESPRLAEQRTLAGRVAVDDDTLAQVLQVVVAAGGTASGTMLQRSLGISGMRLRGLLTGVRALVDVEGYAVLQVEADGTAKLNLDRLAEQFQVDVPRPGEGR